MITGVVLARNEERMIAGCLESLRLHVDEIILIDMESSDATVERARPLVDRILTHPLVPDFDGARNMAIPQARFDWLWFLDADERVSRVGGEYVRRLVRERGHELAAITIPFKSYFCGRWMQHCGWWPGYTMPRVLKRGSFRFSDRLHGGVEFRGAEYRLPPDPELAIEHFSYLSIEHYLEKFNRYTSNEARYARQQGATLDWERPIRAMMRDLWLYYEKNEGHRDGIHGWILSWLAGQYRWFSQVKLLDQDAQKQTESATIPPSLDAVIRLMGSELAGLRSSSPTLPLSIVWRSPVWDPSGYAEDGRVHVKSLAAGRRPLKLEELRWSDHQLQLDAADTTLFRTLCRCDPGPYVAAITSCIPGHPLCRPEPHAAINILRTTFETDRIPTHRLHTIEQFDEVWVFSRENERAFRRSGVAPEKLRVLGSFVDTSLFNPRGRKLSLPDALSDRFVFLSLFDWQYRKGWDVLLTAYCSAFSPSAGAGLLLKLTTLHGHTLEGIQRQMDDALGAISHSLAERPDIVIWETTLDSADMPALYRSANAFVLASRGEGWGRPYMEAMACGLPTIGTSGSGNNDFMDETNSFLIPTVPTDVPPEAAEEICVYRGHRWLEPDQPALVKALQDVASHPERCRRVARKAAADMRRLFSLERARDAVEQLLCHLEQRFTCAALASRPQSTPGLDAGSESPPIRLQWEGELFAGHSFSNINEKLCLVFGDHPALDLSIRRIHQHPTHDNRVAYAHRLRPFIDRPLAGGPQVTVRHAFPPNWQRPATGLWVHIQPWEYGPLPVAWVGPLRDEVDEIWAPSNYVKRVYVQSGIAEEKIHVIPWGVAPQVFQPEAPPLHLPAADAFVFLFVGGTIHRKGFDLLFDAYLTEFGKDDNVCLVIKDLGTTSFYRYGNARERILQAIADERAPRIVYTDENMTEGQLASLYTACHCLVAPYRGEGFGLPILEAMACGLPVIVPRGGASDDFVTEKTALLLPAREVECTHEWRLCGVATELSIDVADVRASMRHTYENQTAMRQMGALASRRTLEQFTWDATAGRMVERLGELCRSGKPQVSSAAPKRQPGLTVCMLAHNDEQIMASALSRAKPYAKEAIVLDLGSTDRTAIIAHESGARVYQGQLADSLANLRNALIYRATSDWILALDADEVLDDQDMQHLLDMLPQLNREVFGVRLPVIGLSAAADDRPAGLLEIRLFRNENEVVYSGRGWSCVQSSIEHLGGRISDCNVAVRQQTQPVDHRQAQSCYRDAETLLRLLHLDLTERRGDAAVLFHLGSIHFGLGNYFHAECYLNDALQAARPADPVYRLAALRLVEAQLKKDEPERAREVAERVLEARPGDKALEAALTELVVPLGV